MWACLKHAPSLRLPSNQIKCWLCGDERPEGALPFKNTYKSGIDEDILEVERDLTPWSKSELNFCEWGDCLELSRPNSKYCSRDCSNKNARKRYADRKKVEK